MKLLRSCALAWFLGLAGMYVCRALLELDLSALPFQISARLWLVGGIGYTTLGLLKVADRSRGARRSQPTAAADLSAVIRRR